EQIEIGDEKAIGIRNPVRQCDDDVPDRTRCGDGDQAIAQRMFVASSGRVQPPLVLAKRLCEELRLPMQPLGAAIDRVMDCWDSRTCRDSRSAKRVFNQLLKSIDLLHLTPQVIVETQHLSDQTRPETK